MSLPAAQQNLLEFLPSLIPEASDSHAASAAWMRLLRLLLAAVSAPAVAARQDPEGSGAGEGALSAQFANKAAKAFSSLYREHASVEIRAEVRTKIAPSRPAPTLSHTSPALFTPH